MGSSAFSQDSVENTLHNVHTVLLVTAIKAIYDIASPS